MKKLLIILLLFSVSLHANYEYSVKGGMNISKAENTYFSSSDNNYNFKSGFALFFTFKKYSGNAYLDLDFGINQKDVEIKNRLSHDSISFYTLELPLTIGYRFKHFNSSFSLYGGGYYSLVILRNWGGDITWGFRNSDNDFLIDAGFLLGFEYNYNNFIFDFRYQRGYGSLVPKDGDLLVHITNNEQFLFLAGWKF